MKYYPIIIGVMMSLGIHACSGKKVGIVDTQKLISGYTGAKEADKGLEQMRAAFSAKTDSMNFVLGQVDRQIQSAGTEAEKMRMTAEFTQMQQAFTTHITELQTQLETRTQEVHSQFTQQLNAYVSEYGKQNGYAYILGANGTGNVLYVDAAEDLTDEVLEYVNGKYAGK